MKLVHDSLESSFLGLIPVCVFLDDAGGEGSQVNEQIDASVRKGRHATAMIAVLDMVDANGIGPKALHELSVHLTLVLVKKRVILG